MSDEIDGNAPAFPELANGYPAATGLTKREYIAIQVLPTVLTDFWDTTPAQAANKRGWREGCAREAFKIADAMIRAEKEVTQE